MPSHEREDRESQDAAVASEEESTPPSKRQVLFQA